MGDSADDHDEPQASGTGDPGERFAERPPESEVAEIEAERERRLAPENRPENTEIDNTGDNMPEIAKG